MSGVDNLSVTPVVPYWSTSGDPSLLTSQGIYLDRGVAYSWVYIPLGTPTSRTNPYELGSNTASHSGSSEFLIIACSIRSRMLGIPSGRFLPFFLGISTRLVGLQFPPFHELTSFTLCSGVLTISLSIPAVALPRLVWVIRRTDNSRFA